MTTSSQNTTKQRRQSSSSSPSGCCCCGEATTRNVEAAALFFVGITIGLVLFGGSVSDLFSPSPSPSASSSSSSNNSATATTKLVVVQLASSSSTRRIRVPPSSSSLAVEGDVPTLASRPPPAAASITTRSDSATASASSFTSPLVVTMDVEMRTNTKGSSSIGPWLQSSTLDVDAARRAFSMVPPSADGIRAALGNLTSISIPPLGAGVFASTRLKLRTGREEESTTSLTPASVDLPADWKEHFLNRRGRGGAKSSRRRKKEPIRILAIGHSHTRYLMAMLCMMVNASTECGNLSDHERLVTKIYDDDYGEGGASSSTTTRPLPFITFVQSNYLGWTEGNNRTWELLSGEVFSSSSSSSSCSRTSNDDDGLGYYTHVIISRGSWDMLFLDQISKRSRRRRGGRGEDRLGKISSEMATAASRIMSMVNDFNSRRCNGNRNSSTIPPKPHLILHMPHYHHSTVPSRRPTAKNKLASYGRSIWRKECFSNERQRVYRLVNHCAAAKIENGGASSSSSSFTFSTFDYWRWTAHPHMLLPWSSGERGTTDIGGAATEEEQVEEQKKILWRRQRRVGLNTLDIDVFPRCADDSCYRLGKRFADAGGHHYLDAYLELLTVKLVQHLVLLTTSPSSSTTISGFDDRGNGTTTVAASSSLRTPSSSTNTTTEEEAADTICSLLDQKTDALFPPPPTEVRGGEVAEEDNENRCACHWPLLLPSSSSSFPETSGNATRMMPQKVTSTSSSSTRLFCQRMGRFIPTVKRLV